MPELQRVFRLFVSSTFRDLAAERDALQADVFPALDELAVRLGYRFEAIDLRWGIRDEVALDQRTMSVCLAQLRRCQRLSPRPNFLILLGDRYGWRPLPETILGGEMEEILRHPAAAPLVDLLGRVYRLDRNADPMEYVLLPRSKDGPWGRYEAWYRDVERPLVRLLEIVAPSGRDPDGLLAPHGTSATHQEILAGALSVPDAREHVHAYRRRTANLGDMIEALPDAGAAVYVDVDADLGFDDRALTKLEILTGDLRTALGPNFREFQAKWSRAGMSTAHIGALPRDRAELSRLLDGARDPRNLCEDVYRALGRVFVAESRAAVGSKPWKVETAIHTAFGDERAEPFVGRAAFLEGVARDVTAARAGLFLVRGPAGSGKSTVMARLARRLVRPTAGARTPWVLERYVGASADSSDLSSLLRGVYDELAARLGEPDPLHAESWVGLCTAFRCLLERVGAEHPTVLLLDGLDQLDPSSPPPGTWLPAEPPRGVRVVVSVRDDARILRAALDCLVPRSAIYAIPTLDGGQADEVLAAFLAAAGRRLTPEQWEHVSQRARAVGQPLFVRLLSEEARLWRSYDGVPMVDGSKGLGRDVPGLVANLLWRLSQPTEHGPLLVERSLAYLSASRSGLAERELLAALSADDDLVEELREGAHHPLQAGRLPFAIWARLYQDLAPYLTSRSSPGGPLLGFFHRQLEEVVRGLLLTDATRTDRHAALARLFAAQDDRTATGDASAPNVRKARELPYQQTLAGQWEEVGGTLSDPSFLEIKCLAGQAHDLAGDYRRLAATEVVPFVTPWADADRRVVQCPHCADTSDVARRELGRPWSCPSCGGTLRINRFARSSLHPLEGSSGSPVARQESPPVADDERRRAVVAELREIARFVGIHVHALAEQPDLLLSLARNFGVERWLGVNPTEAAGRALLELASRAGELLAGRGGSSPWLRLRHCHAEASPWVLSLDAVMPRSSQGVFTPDGRVFIASSGGTATTRDRDTGEALSEIVDVGGGEHTALSPDGRFVAVASGLMAIHIWDRAALGAPRALGPQEPDASGRVSTYHGCLYSPNGLRLASLRSRQMGPNPDEVVVWDLERSRICATTTWSVAASSVDGLLGAFSPDGASLLVGGIFHGLPDGSRWQVVVWDIGSESPRGLLPIDEGRPCGPTGLAWSPDGQTIAVTAGGRLFRWDGSTGSARGETAWSGEAASSCAFSPDGRWLAVATDAPAMRLLDPRSGKEVAATSVPAVARWLAFAPDAGVLAVQANDVVHLADVRQILDRGSTRQRPTRAVALAVSSAGRAVALERDGGLCYSSARDDARGSSRVVTASTPSTPDPTCAAFVTPAADPVAVSLDRSRLAYARQDGGAELVDLVTQTSVVLEGGPVWSLAWSRDGSRLLGIGEATHVWAAGDGALLLTAGAGWGVRLRAGRFLGAGMDAVVVGEVLGGRREVWQVLALRTTTGSVLVDYEPDDSVGRVLGCDADSAGEIVAITQQYRVTLWSRRSLGVIREHTGHPFADAAVSPCGGALAACSTDGWVRVWAVEDGREVAASFLGRPARQVRFDGHARALVVRMVAGDLFWMDVAGWGGPRGGSSVPLVTARRSFDPARGAWAEAVTVSCPWCGAESLVPADLLRGLRCVSAVPTPVPGAGADSGSEEPVPRQTSCCQRPVRFAPFFIDDGLRRPRPARAVVAPLVESERGKKPWWRFW